MTHMNGRVIGKRNKYGLLGQKKYYIQVQFDRSFSRDGKDRYEYQVKADLYNQIVIDAAVRGEFEQVPEGLKPVYFY